MSICTFIASDSPLPKFAPQQDYSLNVHIDTGIIYDGGAVDNYFLNPFLSVGNYTDKKYGVRLEWNYTDGRAKQIMQYIKDALLESEIVELWHVWLMDYYEFEDRPFIHKKEISIDKLTAADIKEIDHANIWNTPDKTYPGRPSFYCLTITR